MTMETNEYDQNVDYKFLEAHEVEVVAYQPWQLGLFYPDLQGKFVWYPKKGTLMFEGGYSRETIRDKGDFMAGSDGSSDSTERVYNEIMSKVNQQQS